MEIDKIDGIQSSLVRRNHGYKEFPVIRNLFISPDFLPSLYVLVFCTKYGYKEFSVIRNIRLLGTFFLVPSEHFFGYKELFYIRNFFGQRKTFCKVIKNFSRKNFLYKELFLVNKGHFVKL